MIGLVLPAKVARMVPRSHIRGLSVTAGSPKP
jgi:hypothetical protein